jgi:hypothetical protein
VEVAGPGHDAPLTQRKMDLRGCDLVRHKGDGGRALPGDTKTDPSNVRFDGGNLRDRRSHSDSAGSENPVVVTRFGLDSILYGAVRFLSNA